MIPLPRRFMTSTMTVMVPKDGTYGGEYKEPVVIERVCFQSTSTIRQTDYQLQSPIKGVVFVDPKISEGAFAVPAGSLVSVDGMVSDACVSECLPVPDEKNLHHWEITLT